MRKDYEVQLMPYTINAISDQTSEVPKGVEMIQAPKLWEKGYVGSNNVIAVIDTGIDAEHPDLEHRVIGGRNFTTDYNGNPNNFSDNNGHGTHVAGTIAASLDSSGVVGVAPQSQMLALKVLTEEGGGNYQWIIDAINYAINWSGPDNERVRVISMSLGGPTDIPELHEAVKRAVENDISIVVAAGNEGDNREETFERAYPGNYNEVIQVGAVNFDRQMAPFTNTNDEIDLVAPGVDILSTFPNGQYSRLSGTSMATPHVAGALSLIINWSEENFERRLTEVEIYAQLIKRTVSLGYEKSTEGNGLLSLNSQVRAIKAINKLEAIKQLVSSH